MNGVQVDAEMHRAAVCDEPPMGHPTHNQNQTTPTLLADCDGSLKSRCSNALNDMHIIDESRPWLANEEQQKLFARYPLFFRAVRYPEAYPSNLAFFGIQCGIGWYPIIEAAVHEIEAELRTMWCEQAHSVERMGVDRPRPADGNEWRVSGHSALR
jgi:hypothetical protein